MPPTPAPAPEAITLRDAAVRLAGQTILHGLSLTLTEPRIGIIGRNGSGKTTLLRLIAGLIAPTAGEVRIAGLNPATDRRGVLRHLGILFQNPDHQIIFPTVAEELAFGLRQLGHRNADAQVTALLARWGRAHWAGASVSTLSQGQRQFLCLLAVLAMEPATILLDEPFSGLDLPMRARLARELARLAQRVIVITHDPTALTGFDRVIWLEAGKVRGDGAPAAVLPLYEAEMTRLGGLDADADIAP